MKVMKKIGWFFMTLLPTVSALGIQIVVGLVVAIAVGISTGVKAAMEGISEAEMSPEMMAEMTDSINTWLIVGTHLAMILVFALWYRFGCGKNRFKDVDKKRIFSGKTILTTVLVAIGMNLFITFVLTLILPVLPEGLVESYQTMMDEAGFATKLLPLLAAAFLAPIGEELLCRGVTFYYGMKLVKGMSPKAGFWVVNVLQAMLFGVLHMNIIQGAYAFVLGLILGCVRQYYKSVIPAIGVHMVFNCFSTFVLDNVEEFIPENIVVYVAGLVVGLGMMVSAVLINKKKAEVAA